MSIWKREKEEGKKEEIKPFVVEQRKKERRNFQFRNLLIIKANFVSNDYEVRKKQRKKERKN